MHAFGGLRLGEASRERAFAAALAGEGAEAEGLSEEEARLAGLLGRELDEGVREAVARALAWVPVPGPALLRLLDLGAEGVRELGGHTGALARFALIASQSGVYGRLLVQEPSLLWAHAERCGEEAARLEAMLSNGEAVAKGKAAKNTLKEAAAAFVASSGAPLGKGPGKKSGEAAPRTEEAESAEDQRFMEALRRWKRFAMLEVVEAEVTQAVPVERSAGRIAEIASQALAWATRLAVLREGAQGLRFCVLGMGKLGGGELNLSSDVDLIYVMDPEPGAPVERAPAVARRVTALVGEATALGPVFRVDLRLRPFGTQGPLVHTVASLRDYYEAHGRTWERGAMIRMAPVAGDLAVGERVQALLRPFVFRRNLDASAIGEVAEMKRAVAGRSRAEGEGGFDVKVGRGGIREVEFFVQAFQLVYGGRHPELQVRGTLDALRRLSEVGLVPERELRELLEAYRFLRLLEHRIMMEEERQTHALPVGAGLEALALRMGFVDAAEFGAELDGYRERVAGPFARLFGDSPVREHAWLSEVLGAEEDAAALARLEALGVVQARRALRDLRRLAAPPEARIGDFAPGPVRRAVEGLLEQCVASADPDRALDRCVQLLDSRHARGTLLGILRARPQAAVVLAGFFSAAEELGLLLVRSPGYLESVMAAAAAPVLGREALEAALAERLRGAPEGAGGVEGRLVEVRKFRRGEELRVALGLLSGRLGLREATDALSDVADLCLKACLREAVASLGERAPERAEERMAAIAMGKLGARELGFGADLDLVFVYEGEAAEAGAFARLVQRWISYLTTPMAYGALYAVDMRLRPDGQQGAVVTGVGGFGAYYRERAWAWERLALVRARVVTGAAPLRAAIEEVLREGLDALELPEARKALSALREKRLAEAEGAAGRPDIKGRAGGLVDLEWSLQLAWMRVREAGTLGGRSTWALLDVLQAEKALTVGEREELRTILELYRRLEVWIRLSEGEDRNVLPAPGPRRRSIAARVIEGVGDPERRLDEALDEAGDRVRKLVSEWLVETSDPPASA